MSPDERTFDAIVAGAIRRGRIVCVLEAVGWVAAAAAVSVPIGVVIGLALMAWRLRGSTRNNAVRALERAHGDGRNLFVTADELRQGRIQAGAETRLRVDEDATRLARTVDVGSVYPMMPFVRAIGAAAAMWLLVPSTHLWKSPVSRLTDRLMSPAAVAGRSSAGRLQVTVTTEPPRYTGLPLQTLIDPTEIVAVQGTTMVAAIDPGKVARVTIDHDGVVRQARSDTAGPISDRIELTKNGYYSIETSSGARRVIPIVVTPDALPDVRITVPGHDLVFADPNQQLRFEVRARDDFGLRSLSLQYTKVAGSGEEFEFREGDVPIAITRSSDREWAGAATRSLRELGLQNGDMLVYRALGADSRPGAPAASSDPYFIEISTLGAAAGDGFTIPEEETRYALSQQMLVVKTQRLDRRRGSMPSAEFGEAAMNLAIEQRMIRAEFVFMLGGEIEDEEVEAAQSTELQEGRLQNRGQRDLRRATVSMSQAEKLLTAGTTREALTAERDAIAALQRAFARDRYILRALAGRTTLDLKRRLTGTLAQAGGWKRARPAAIENRRAALLQDLLAGVGSLRPDVAVPAIVELAGETLRIDADSASLRRVAADLQKAADDWSTTAVGVRQRALDRITSAVSRETVASLAGAPLPTPFVAPSLAGAFKDALNRKGSDR